jgi:Right handed beta helix region
MTVELPINASSFSGVDPTGETDSTAGLQAWLNAAAAAGLAAYCPGGTYVVSSTLTYAPTAGSPTGLGGCIFGDGRGLTVFRPSSATADFIDFVSGDITGTDQPCFTLRDFTVVHTGSPTAGVSLNFSTTEGGGAPFTIIEDIDIFFAYDGIVAGNQGDTGSPGGGGDSYEFHVSRVATFCTNIDLWFPVGFLSNAHITDCFVNTIVISDGDTFWLNNTLCNKGINVVPTSPDYVTDIEANNTQCGGWLFASSGGGLLGRVNLTGCFAANNITPGFANGHGFEFDGAQEVMMSACIAIGSYLVGIYIGTGCQAVTIGNCVVAGNSQGAQGSYAGIYIAPNVTKVIIKGNNIGTTPELSSATQKYGVQIATGSGDYITVADNILTGNVTAGLINGATGSHNIIHDNSGYNPVGTSAAASTGTSGSTITAGPSPETHYVQQSATFNAAVTKGGQSLGTVPSAHVPIVVQLGPNERYSVAWSTTQPKYVKDVH